MLMTCLPTASAVAANSCRRMAINSVRQHTSNAVNHRVVSTHTSKVAATKTNTNTTVSNSSSSSTHIMNSFQNRHFTTSSSSSSASTSSSSSSSTSTSSQRNMRRLAAQLGASTLGAFLVAAAAVHHATPSSPASAPTSASSSLAVAACAGLSTTVSASSTPILTDNDIMQRIGAHQNKLNVEKGVIKEIHWNNYNANPEIEDSFSIYPQVNEKGLGGAVLGVYDGHSGKAASSFCRNELIPYLVYYRWSKRTDQIIHARPFLEADHHFLQFALDDGRVEDGLSGACLCVSHVVGKKIMTANAGDCRAIVGRRLSKCDGTFRWQAVELTTDHQIDSNHLERERLLREHPNEPDVIYKHRVKGRLQPTRGLGDGKYKRMEYFYAQPRLVEAYRQTGWTVPYTTAQPDITTHNLQSNDEFLVLATDGLFADLTSQQVVDLVGEWMQRKAQHKPNTHPTAAAHLTEAALVAASEYSIGRRNTQKENISWVLQLPESKRRSIHDDITVLVTFFDHDSKYPSDMPETSTSKGPAIPPTLDRAIKQNIVVPPAKSIVAPLPPPTIKSNL